MYKTEGYWNVTPRIKRLSFPRRGKFQVDLQDGRSILMPISAFPSLKRVPVKEREHWYLMGGGVTWDSCPEVIHVEQILGNFHNYAHERPEEAITRWSSINSIIFMPYAKGKGIRALYQIEVVRVGTKHKFVETADENDFRLVFDINKK